MPRGMQRQPRDSMMTEPDHPARVPPVVKMLLWLVLAVLACGDACDHDAAPRPYARQSSEARAQAQAGREGPYPLGLDRTRDGGP